MQTALDFFGGYKKSGVSAVSGGNTRASQRISADVLDMSGDISAIFNIQFHWQCTFYNTHGEHHFLLMLIVSKPHS